MKKTVMKVFLIIGALFLCFIVWDLVFNEGGILSTAWNAIIAPINKLWTSVAGTGAKDLLPKWEAGAAASAAQSSVAW